MTRLVRLLIGMFLVLIAASTVAALVAAAAAGIARTRMASSGDAESDEFDVIAIYDGAEFASRAPALRRARVIAWFGGADVDLRGATLDPAGARIEAKAAWGGATIRVPKGWRVRMHSLGLFGGAGSDVNADSLPEDAPTLDVDSLAVFGGVAVTTGE
jgi:hypothetical protein